jgi:hypothetical protein
VLPGHRGTSPKMKGARIVALANDNAARRVNCRA